MIQIARLVRNHIALLLESFRLQLFGGHLSKRGRTKVDVNALLLILDLHLAEIAGIIIAVGFAWTLLLVARNQLFYCRNVHWGFLFVLENRLLRWSTVQVGERSHGDHRR